VKLHLHLLITVENTSKMSFTRCRYESQLGGCTNKNCTFVHDDDDEHLRTLYCQGVSKKVDEEILYELFLNAGPLEKVVIPKDKETKQQKTFGFIVFQHQESTEFAYNLLNGTELFGQPIRLQNKATGLGIGQQVRDRYGLVGSRHQRSYTEPGNIRHDVRKQGAGGGGFSVPGLPSNSWYITTNMSRMPASRGIMFGGDLERREREDAIDVNMNRMENHKAGEVSEKNKKRYFDTNEIEAAEEYGEKRNKTFHDELKGVKEFIELKRKTKKQKN